MIKIRKFLSQPEVRYALALFLLLRLWSAAVASAAVVLIGAPPEPDPVLRPYLGQKPIDGGLAGILLGPWQRFDTLWYIKIAAEGYSPGGGTTNFPPLYPLLIRLVTPLLGGNFLLSALVISNLAALLGFIALGQLINSQTDSETSRLALLYLSFSPSAFFLVAGYTESLFLFLVVLGFIAARKERWAMVGLLGFLGALTRKEGGVVLLLAFLYLYLEKRDFHRNGIRRDILWLGLILLGNLIYILIPVWISGGFQGWEEISRAWNLTLAPPWVSLWAAVRTIFSWPIPILFVVDLATTLGFLLLTVWAFRSLPKVYTLYMAVTILVFLVWFRPALPLISMTRHAILLFPGFIALAKLARGKWDQRLVLTSFALLQTYFLTLFAIWEWVG